MNRIQQSVCRAHFICSLFRLKFRLFCLRISVWLPAHIWCTEQMFYTHISNDDGARAHKRALAHAPTAIWELIVEYLFNHVIGRKSFWFNNSKWFNSFRCFLLTGKHSSGKYSAWWWTLTVEIETIRVGKYACACECLWSWVHCYHFKLFRWCVLVVIVICGIWILRNTQIASVYTN